MAGEQRFCRFEKNKVTAAKHSRKKKWIHGNVELLLFLLQRHKNFFLLVYFVESKKKKNRKKRITPIHVDVYMTQNFIVLIYFLSVALKKMY